MVTPSKYPRVSIMWPTSRYCEHLWLSPVYHRSWLSPDQHIPKNTPVFRLLTITWPTLLFCVLLASPLFVTWPTCLFLTKKCAVSATWPTNSKRNIPWPTRDQQIPKILRAKAIWRWKVGMRWQNILDSVHGPLWANTVLDHASLESSRVKK